MARTIEIDCVTRANRFEPASRITHVGGSRPCRWKITEDEAIRSIEDGEWIFFVRAPGGDAPVTVAQSDDGHRTLRAEIGPESANHLLDLPPCP